MAAAQSTQAKALDALRGLILTGRIPPNAQLSELTLSEALGMSRTPIREALKQLQVEGLVTVKPRVGTFVAVPSRREVVELSQVREAVEGLGARLFAEARDPDQLARLDGYWRREDEASSSNDVDAWVELNQEFHLLIVSSPGNAKLVAHYTMLINQLGFSYNRLVYTTLRQGRLPHLHEEHGAIVGAVREGDGRGAELAMQQHIRNGTAAALEAFDATVPWPVALRVPE